MCNFLLKGETHQIIGCCYNVYNQMGSGFLEAVYQECLELEFAQKHIPADAQLELDIFYHNQLLRQKYIPDFICFGEVIVEIKAVKALAPEHTAQLLNYLKITNKKVGLLVNFASYPKIEYKRIANTRS